ncbi:hypothetical protein DFQ27_002238 [Actinomortierella ambigua]|uniref:Rho-GAP domain-containing protein n=1 Tax=Actinomortierella ambigua TaxID=1343610 RepID=A0A9P6QA26_9FUNG|nr:hypothetical protein DFQ27_002238 [Actinomortierella ambigua]
MKKDFSQCLLPIEFVYRIVVACVDEIMERGLNHRFIMQNQYSASVVAAMLTLMADPKRRHLFSLKCMRIDTVVGVMLSVLKNIRETIVPHEIQEELTSASDMFLSAASSPTSPVMAQNGHFQPSPSSGSGFSHSQSAPRINTVASLLNHPNFPAVNRALLMELLNLSLALLNRSTFNSTRPDVLAGVLGPLIFATQHATILQHTPQQAYSFGWGVSLVSDIQRCSKMFYVVLGGYRREVLGPVDFDYDQSLFAAAAADVNAANDHSRTHSISPGASRGGYPGSTSGDISNWIGSTSKASMMANSGSHGAWNGFGSGMATAGGGGGPRSRLRVHTESHSPLGNNRLRSEFGRLGDIGDISTTFTESVRAAAAEEARQLGLHRSSSGNRGRAALAHLREAHPHDEPGGGNGSRLLGGDTGEDSRPELFRVRLRPTAQSALLYESNGSLAQQSRQQHLSPILQQQQQQQQREEDRSGTMSSYERQREERRQEIESMIRGYRGAGLNSTIRDSNRSQEDTSMVNGRE